MQSKRIVRVFLSSKGLNQDEDSIDQPSWIFRLEGRLIEEKDVCTLVTVGSNSLEVHNLSQCLAMMQAGKAARRKLSTFFRKIFIELDSPVYGDHARYIEWQRDANTVDCDGFEVKRRGSDPIRVCQEIVPLTRRSCCVYPCDVQ